MVFTGNGGLLAINNVVKRNTMYNIAPGATKYGIKVMTLETPFGVWHIKRHPRFTQEVSNTQSMLIFEPRHLRYRYITDTMFKADDCYGKGGGTGKDGKEEEFLTEAGLEYHHPETAMYLSNIGVDNTVTP